MKTYSKVLFEVKASYTTDDSKKAKVLYIVEAFSFGEAERIVCEYMADYAYNDAVILAIKSAPYREVCIKEDGENTSWYRVKVKLITFDERTGKEKYVTSTILVQSEDVNHVSGYVNEFMGMQDFVIVSIVDTDADDVMFKC